MAFLCKLECLIEVDPGSEATAVSQYLIKQSTGKRILKFSGVVQRSRPAGLNCSMPRTPNDRFDSTKSTSPLSSPSKKSALIKARGPIPASEETSYHRRLRGILLDHRKARKEWNELVIRGCVARARNAVELWADVNNCCNYLAKEKHVRSQYVLTQTVKFREQLEAIAGVETSLREVLASMRQILEKSEYLVIEAAKTRGMSFAFREPLWVTWPLAKFVDELQARTTPYVQSFTLIHESLLTLTTLPLLLEGDMETNTSEPRTTRNHSRDIQAVMSLLAVQPLLPGKIGHGVEAWEEIMAVEVGSWEDVR